MAKRLLLCAALCAVSATVAPAQGRPNPAVQREAMQKLAFLVGQWKGEATVTMGPGGPKRLQQTEDIQFKLDGLALLVEGTGRDPASGTVEFNALATIAFDEASGTYRFRAHSGGNYLETELKLKDRGFEWGYTAGSATVSNSMHLDDTGQWVEFTDVVIGGAPPRRTTELRVRK
jgi:hypothetical protein